jgi:hypothetical protein
MENEMAFEPRASFYRLIDQARLPQRADRSAQGILPTRATRYCEAVTSATAFGWWLFPPMDFSVIWDGTDLYWHYADQPDWLPLDTAQFPDFANRFDSAAPDFAPGLRPSVSDRAARARCFANMDGTVRANCD